MELSYDKINQVLGHDLWSFHELCSGLKAQVFNSKNVLSKTAHPALGWAFVSYYTAQPLVKYVVTPLSRNL